MSYDSQKIKPPVRTSDRSTMEELPVKTDPTSSPILDAAVGADPPIENAHPGLQPALVFASYPLALIVLISITAVYFFFSDPAQTEARLRQFTLNRNKQNQPSETNSDHVPCINHQPRDSS